MANTLSIDSVFSKASGNSGAVDLGSLPELPSLNQAIDSPKYNNGGSTGVNFFNSGLTGALGGVANSVQGLLSGTKTADVSGHETAAASSFWTDLFLRSVIIILGFVFVAAGLAMFQNKSITITNAFKKAIPGG